METSDLVHLTPLGAIVAMVNYENRTAFRPDALVAGPPEVVEGTLTRVRLTARRSAGLNDVVPDPGYFDFLYHRLDVDTYFRGLLNSFRPRMPTSTQVLVDELSIRLAGQKFYPEDFEQDYIDRANAAPYVLRAGANSLRWVGSTEVVLGDWPDLGVYLADATPAMFHSIPEPLELASQSIGFSFINATPSLQLIQNLPENVPFQNDPSLALLVNATINASPLYVGGPGPWVVSSTPGPYNLYNAVVLDRDLESTDGPWQHPTNTNLTRSVWIRLDLSYCTNFSDPDVYLPYQPHYDSLSEFSEQPRMKNVGVISPSDASQWNVLFNSYQIGDTLSGWPAQGLMISGLQPWYTNPSVASRTNLAGAIVQYNGQRRTQDLPPATPGLNRILVVTVDETLNTAYTGPLSFHYRAPILVTEVSPIGDVGIPYNFDLAPSGGTGPYTVLAEDLPPGLSMDGTVVTGSPTTAGVYNPIYTVTDSAGVEVVYQIRLQITN